MLQIHRILHPTDFSEFSMAAFHMAATLAHDYAAKLTVLHVAPPVIPVMIGGAMPISGSPMADPKYRQALLDQLHEIKTDYQEVVIDHVLVEGDPATEILAIAKDAGADLIVLGTHGRTGLGRLLMGSVAETVLREAPCPVLTIKTPLKPLAQERAVYEAAVSI